MNHHRHTRRALAVVLPTLAAALTPAAASAAAPVSFTCAASAATVQVLDGAPQAPVRAGEDGSPCRRAAAGLQDAGALASTQSKIQAKTAYASVDPHGDRPVRSTPSAAAGVEGLSLVAAGLPLTVDTARSSLSARCASGRAAFAPTSQVASIRLGSATLVADGVVQPVTGGLTNALGGAVSVRLDEVVDLPGGGKAVRAAHVRVTDGSRVLADVVVAESRIDLSGAACDPVAGDQPTTGSNPGGNAGGGDSGSSGCPNGSVLDRGRDLCVIPVPGSRTAANPAGDLTGSGSVVVGAPGTAPSGGTVVGLAQARKRFPKSPCVRGSGPAYVVVGTKRADRLTGTRRANRLLGLGGRDKLDGGGGRDCVDGGRSHDVVTGGQGSDRVYGGGARDLVNGDGGSDRLHGGSGNDVINAATGSDRVWAGAGRDRINVATAGSRARVRGGRGRDKVRCNRNELRRISGVERIIVTHVVR